MLRVFGFIKKICKYGIIGYYRACTLIFPVNRKIIMFESNLGRNYTGNPRAIYEEMVRQGLDLKFRCYIILEDIRTSVPGNAKKVKKNRLLYFYLMAISGIWICDTRLQKHIIKRRDCTYIQTWHGTPLKKLALDMDSVFMAGEITIDEYKKHFYKNTRTWDYLLSQNAYSTEIFRRAFAFDKTILEIGYPRNDLLFHRNNEKDIQDLKKLLGLPSSKRIMLYAPTWRDNEFYAEGRYKFNPPLDFSYLQREFGKDSVIIVKYHYLIMDQIDFRPYEGFLYTYDLSYDISLLYLVSDLLITDYSSVMFDYSILNRPMFFYCYDLNEYQDTLRGFYFDFIKEAPGPVALTTKDLSDSIKNYDSSEYREKYDDFRNKYNHADDGNASVNIVKLIKELTTLNSKL